MTERLRPSRATMGWNTARIPPAAGVHLGDQGVEQERHVVIDGDEHAVVLAIGGVFFARGDQRYFVFARLMRGDALQRQARQRGERFRRVAVHIVGAALWVERVEERLQPRLARELSSRRQSFGGFGFVSEGDMCGNRLAERRQATWGLALGATNV